MVKIVCPICDEELGNSLDEIPEKCPICDTRRHEILQEIQEQATPSNAMPKLMVDGNLESVSPNFDFQPTVQESVQTEETKEEPETPQSSEWSNFNPEPETPIQNPEWSNFSTEPETPIQNPEWSNFNTEPETPIQNPEWSNFNTEPETPIQNPEWSNFNTEPETPIQNPEWSNFMQNKHEENDDDESIVCSESNSELTQTQESEPEEPEYIPPAPSYVSSTEEPVQQEEPEPVQQEEPEPVQQAPVHDPNKPSKSGASDLEWLPFGYKYCPSCNAVYDKAVKETQCTKCAEHPVLTVVDKGFPPGDYLVLYNHERKAIAYFRLTREGSIFIGRSSERGSSSDIDLSLAWKHYYQRHYEGEEIFKERMRLLKGISRKHALVRYSKEDGHFLLFHLSDNNYTAIQLPDGEKRIRAPKNRKKVELQGNTILSLGNHKDFIILRFKQS